MLRHRCVPATTRRKAIIATATGQASGAKRREAGPGWRNRILRWAIFAFGVILAGALVLQFVVESEDVGMPPLAYAIVAGLMGLATWYELMGTGR